MIKSATFKILFVVQAITLLCAPFAASADHNFDHTISQITLQIKILQEKILALISVPTAEPVSLVVAPLPATPGEPPKPSLDLLANDSDGSIEVPFNSSVVLSWKLSDHAWSYCTRLHGWSGGIKPVSGSETTGSLTYGHTYTLYCYVDGTRYSDSVVVNVAPEVKKVEPVLEPTPSAAAPANCTLAVSKPSVTLGKDAIEATWILKSDPPGWPFYWHGTDNGKEIDHYYGGKTDAIINTSYNNIPAVYTRYFEVVQDTGFVVNDPNHPKPTCVSNTLRFEIKANTSKAGDSRNFLANILNALTEFVQWVRR